MRTLLQDIRYGARMLVKNPGFTAVAVLTLALGIGANTAIFSVVNATLLRPFPFDQPDRLMLVFTARPAMYGQPPRDDGTWSYPKYQTFREHQRAFEELALYCERTYNLTGTASAERVIGEVVGGGYFSVLGIRPVLGRSFLAEEDATPNTHYVALIGYGLWQRMFGADPNVVGKLVKLDNRDLSIVGVAPRGFQGLTGRAEVWIPTMIGAPSDLTERWSHFAQIVGRRKPGITEEQAKSGVAVAGKLVDEAHPDPRFPGWGAAARSLEESRVDRNLRIAVLVLFGAVIGVVLIACVNVANLLLARGRARQREIAVRLAVGASRGRIARLLLAESLLLALIGAAAGLVLAQWGVGALGAINPASNPFGRELRGLVIIGLSSIRIDATALVFTLGAALITSALFGLAPALQASRQQLTAALKTDSTSSRRFLWLRALTGQNILVLAEVALSFVLLVGSGLMIKSLGRLLAANAGIDPENILTLRMQLSPGQYKPESALTFFEQLQARAAALPSVQSVGLTGCPPLSGGCNGTSIRFPDRPPAPRGSEPLVGIHWVSGDYFQTLKIPLLRGRWFTPQNREGAPKVVLINEAVTRQFWPGEDPLGKAIAVGQGGFHDRAEVVGIVGNVRYSGMEQRPGPDVFLSYRQSVRDHGTLFVRASGDPLALAAAIRREIQALNKDLAVYDIKTMRQRIGDATAAMRFSALLLAVFAAIAVMLAAVGIFGVTSYAVAQRTREIGVRIALGALPSDVLRLVVRRAATFILPGITIGLFAALGLTRFLRTLLYEVKPNDPATYVLLALLFAAVALLASYMPARRAAKVDPIVALRYE